jgi:DNA primase catalytic core
MTYYDKKTIERVKRFSLVDILRRDGLVLKKQGQDYFAHCPFHDDKTPSFSVTPDKNLWHCLGACQTGGSPIDYVMHRDRVGFKTAVGTLLNEHGEQPFDDKGVVAKAIENKSIENNSTLPAKVERTDAQAQQWLNQTVALYHKHLLQSSQAKAYLAQRGLDNPQLIDTFKLGYAQKQLGTILPTRTSQAGKDARALLKTIGVTLESGMERFSGSLVVPVMTQDQVMDMYGRKIAAEGKLRPGTAKHLYLPGGHQGVWNQQGLTSDTVILCESLIDAMSFWVHGFTNVTCSYGTNGFTPSHLAVFNGLGVKRVLIAYDNDDAGNQAALTLADTLREHEIEPWRVQLPPGEDINGFMVQSAKPAKDLEALLNQAYVLSDSPEVAPSALPAQDLPKVEPHGDDWHITFANRLYRIRGLAKTPQGQQLRINLMLRVDETLHIDSVDLYHAKQRTRFIEQAAQECALSETVVKQDLSRVLLILEDIQQGEQETTQTDDVVMTDAEREEALSLLRHPDLLGEIVADFARCGVVGEQSNTLVGYLACVSRKLDKPLALVIQSSSAAGKSALMDAILHLCPDEDVTQFSAMTGQSLFYMEGMSLKHRILAISEEEGASQAAYALKLLQSQGSLTMASTGKDADTGQLVTQTYEVEGPTMLFLTTTAIDVDEELMNRCLVLTVNESREQTQPIHALQRQRRTLQGLLERSHKQHIITRHQHAQRLLRPLHVVNPYAEQLTFMDDKTRTRRDHEKYLTLIDTIALLHQYQREVKRVAHPDHKGEVLEYVEVTTADIHMANQLARDTLGRTLDELPAQTRKLLNHCVDWVTCQAKVDEVKWEAVRFTRKQLRDATGWSDTALKVHLARLVEMEYLLVHRGEHRQRYHYELLYQSDSANHTRLKLIDLHTAHPDRSGQIDNRSGAGQAAVNGLSGGGQGDENAPYLNGHKAWPPNTTDHGQVDTTDEKYTATVKVSS